MEAQRESIRKPDIDEREYRLITLRNNLEAMIISDPKANQCKISLVVALARRARGPTAGHSRELAINTQLVGIAVHAHPCNR
jgi:hypothetical protein